MCCAEILLRKVVFILYSPDHPSHKEAVRHLANFMEKRCACEVILDVHCHDQINRNKDGWLEKSMNRADKILLISSEGTVSKADASDSGQEYHSNFHALERPIGNIFTPAYEMIRRHSRLQDKLVLALFDYSRSWQLPNLNVNLNYVLPADMEKVCMRIHDIAECKRGKQHFYHISVQASDIMRCQVHGEPLFREITKMRAIVADNPLWFDELYDSGVGLSYPGSEMLPRRDVTVSTNPGTPTTTRFTDIVNGINDEFDQCLGDDDDNSMFTDRSVAVPIHNAAYLPAHVCQQDGCQGALSPPSDIGSAGSLHQRIAQSLSSHSAATTDNITFEADSDDCSI